MMLQAQELLFPEVANDRADDPATSSTFVKNMTLPVHRWFRYSAGFSSDWVESVIVAARREGPVHVVDPFAGSGTTLLAGEMAGVETWGVEAHPFVCRIARAKLAWRSDPKAYHKKIEDIRKHAQRLKPQIEQYPKLIRACYTDECLAQLDVFRHAYDSMRDNTPASELAWLTLVAILRRTSKAGTAQWQYVLPKKRKRAPIDPVRAFQQCSQMIYEDMLLGQSVRGPRANFLQDDARACAGVPSGFANLVVTSPPYPNNYDYADATRLEMCFFREITSWGDLQETVRKHLVRSCSQHVPEKAVRLAEVLCSPALVPIHDELTSVCDQLSRIREFKGGKKTYHLMVACYFLDMAQAWMALRRVCGSPSRVCWVIGDSAPYGIYVPVVPWLGRLALAAGFRSFRFEKTRDRNIKWRNRKHRVPLQEGRLWVEG